MGGGKGRGRGGGAPKGGSKGDKGSGKGDKGAKGGKGKGRGGGCGGGGEARAVEADPPAKDGRPSDNGYKAPPSSKESSNALRALSSPQWWLIGQGLDSSAAEIPAPRKRGKPEAFMRQCAEKHAEMVKLYESAMANDGEQRWLRKVSGEGTMGDRVAALNMLIQVCPVLSCSYIKALLNLAGKMGRSDTAMAVDALKDLFISTLLPDRKLKTFGQMEPVTEKHLGKELFAERCVAAYFEDYLKTAFAAFVQVLGEAAGSSVIFFRIKAVRTSSDLLASKPEQERALLGLLVNKFGDLTAKVSSLVLLCLQKLEQAHPMMKRVIAREIETFLLRHNMSSKSRYQALLHLTEMVMTRREEDTQLAAQLIKIYVAQLEATLKPAPSKKVQDGKKVKWWKKPAKGAKSGLREDDNKLVRTLINGIQRALPYLEAGLVTGTPLEGETVDALFRICHTVSAFSTRIAILGLLFRCFFSKGDPPDRFYRLLYEQLTQFDFWSCSHKQKAYLLLRQCVPADRLLSRGVALARRILQVGANAEPAVAAAGLAVLRELFLAHRAEIKPLIGTIDKELRQPQGADDDAEEVFVDDGAFAPKGGSDDEAPYVKGKGDIERYQPLVREPKHAKARHTPIWELHALAKHVHPFVAHGAARLLAHDGFKDAGSNLFDDLSCHELLEQFAYVSKAPKAKSGAGAGKNSKPAESAAKILFNSDKFLKKKTVLPHEKFFQLYFTDGVVKEANQRKAKARKQNEDEVDEEKTQGAGASTLGAGGGDSEAEADAFFDEHLEGMMPPDEEGGEEGPDIDDDSEGDSDMSGSGEGGESEGDDDDDGEAGDDEEKPASESGSDEGESGGEDSVTPAKGAKRKAGKAGLPTNRKEKLKALKKKHSGGLFASVEDFEQLLAEDA